MAKQRRQAGNDSNRWQGEDLIDKLVVIKRTAKVVKGGARFNFSAIVIVGDGKGRVGYGLGKAKEVPESIRKATEKAQRNLVQVPLRENRTLFHEMVGRYGAGKVVLRPAAPGTGIIAGGSMRPIFECLGIRDVLAKSIGTSNPHNLIKAAFVALQSIRSPDEISQKRGLSPEEVRI